MYTFLIGLAVLLVGGCLYGRFCERVFQPDRRTTPAYAQADGVNYVPMKRWKNALIELLNIAGTGPVLGPIQGILFGPIAFVLIPIGCVLGGEVHDYFSGMLSLRHKGAQMPGLMQRFMGKGVYQVYNIFVCLLMFLVGVVFIYTPGDMLAGSVLGLSTSFVNAETGASLGFEAMAPVLIIYAIILAYYLVATLFPIDKIIGRIYPVFGAVLLLSAVVGWFVGRPLVRFASQPEQFRQWVDGHGLMGCAAYVGMVFLQVVVAVIPGEPLEISGGYAFGAVRGSLLCLLGAFLGSVAVFALVRRFGRELVDIFFPREKLEKLKFLQSSPKRDALFWLVFMVPGTPKDLLCYFAGLTDLSWGKWLLLCTVGRLPSVLTSTIGGDALGVKDYQFAMLVFAATLAVSAVGLLIYRALCRRHQRRQEHV